MAREKTLALRERDRVRRDLRDAFECGAGNADQEVRDGNYDFGLNMQAARNQQIVGTMHRPSQAVFDRRENVVRYAILEARIEGVECGSRNKLDVSPKSLMAASSLNAPRSP